MERYQRAECLDLGVRRLAAALPTMVLSQARESGSKLPHSRGLVRVEQFLPIALVFVA